MAGLDWPGLLAWSTKYHDGTAPSEFKQLSDEDREFLQKAMEQAFGEIEDPNEVMLEAIKQIKAEDRTDASIITALEIIDRSCDDRDCARNAEKLDGVQPLLDLAVTSTGSIKVRTLEILALLFANNPNIQEAGARRGAMKIFIELVKGAPQGSEERSKAFRALVALARGVDALEEQLLKEHDGSNIIVMCMALEEDARSREKALSFVQTLAVTGRLDEIDAKPFAAATTKLFSGNLAEASLQYRETLAMCACEVARISSGEAVLELEAAIKARLESAEADAEVEEPQLKEAVAACRK